MRSISSSSFAEHVATDEVTRTVYSTDNSIYQIRPAGVALPTTPAEIYALVAANAQHDDPLPIVARGGGTGTNGQSLTDGVVIDLKRNLNSIISIDASSRTAIVEPGVVADALNAELKDHGLFWAPHTSTLSRATVGGMIATDAAGKGSLVHGRAHRHVLSLTVCLDDGTEFIAEPVSIAEAERRAQGPDRVGEVWRALLDLDIAEGDDFELPELARGFSGYGIDRLRRDGLLNPLALLVGAEGTLGITTQATLHLSPMPTHTALIVAAYRTFADALEDAVALRATQPSAIESFDERTLNAGRDSPSWAALDAVIGDVEGSILLVEYSSDETIEDAPLHAAIEANGRALKSLSLRTPGEQAAAWKVRADAVGLVAKIEVGAPAMSARPTAMVEDCAVPVASMVDFISEFRATLDGFGVEYAMFGHADVGCVHVRPALDTTDPSHEALVRQITDAVVEVVRSHKGVLWGEHGRGFRGEVAPEFLHADTISLMRQIKTIFDPSDLFNPGKLYRPVGIDSPLIAVDEAPMRGQANRAVPVTIRREFHDAFVCNGNGLCHQHGPSDPMCPSFKASGDPALSPKGRADLLRSFLVRREHGGDPTFEDALAANLHQCLSCSACTGTCPVEVDIPELKSKFLEVYYETRRRPLSHGLLSRFESLAAVATSSPMLARYGSKPAGQVLGLVDLPVPKKSVRRSAFATFSRRTSREPTDVVLLRDVFTYRLEPETIEQAGNVLARLGFRVAFSPFVASGKFDHVKGKRKAFAKAAQAQAELIDRIIDAGAIPVAIEPATALLHEREYPAIYPSYPKGVRHLVDVLHEQREGLRESAARSELGVSLLGHCTERAMRPESLRRWADVLDAAGYRTSTPDLGCCGMAGIFGHEVENQAMSKSLWNLGWDDAVRGKQNVVATGYSCRSQAQRLTHVAPLHPIHLL
ncbi:MAG: FAD/FMN-containing dehydrogenase/Fe-S oxidoreductase [Verrucomicrobiales bacterium]|jgi:FAD/FMN-containing dehydrogenase/Fe-S oxidoreductase